MIEALLALGIVGAMIMIGERLWPQTYLCVDTYCPVCDGECELTYVDEDDRIF